MEVKDLAPFVVTLLLVSMIVAVGVLCVDKFSVATKVETAVANETIAFTAGVGTTANDEILTTSSSMLANGTAVTLAIGNAYTGSVTLATPADYTGDVYTAYTYDADSQTSLVLDAGRDAIGDVSTDWMALIVVIGVLALVLGLTIAGFSYFGGRR